MLYPITQDLRRDEPKHPHPREQFCCGEELDLELLAAAGWRQLDFDNYGPVRADHLGDRLTLWTHEVHHFAEVERAYLITGMWQERSGNSWYGRYGTVLLPAAPLPPADGPFFHGSYDLPKPCGWESSETWAPLVAARENLLDAGVPCIEVRQVGDLPLFSDLPHVTRVMYRGRGGFVCRDFVSGQDSRKDEPEPIGRPYYIPFAVAQASCASHKT